MTVRDKDELNTALTEMILSTLRPYQIANEPFLKRLMVKALEVGARHGNAGTFKFELSGTNRLISADGVRQKLDSVYDGLKKY